MSAPAIPQPVSVSELAVVDLFHALPADALAELAAGAEVCRFRAGEVVFAEGDPGDDLYVVRSGALNVLRPNAYPEVILETVEPGRSVGELAVINEAERLANVIAVRDTETVRIGKDALDAVLTAYPEALRQMLGDVARSLTLAKESLARQKAVLEQRVRERTEELRQTNLETVRRLAQAAEWRDDQTGLHITRMSRLVYRLARRAGLDDDEAETLMHASTMHDIGKIGIPDRILLKPGPLDAAEWEQMKTHTVIGAQLLAGSRSPTIQLAELVARTHHERWDGAGYPAGLAGDDIPLAARICAICDVFDALVSERPYKPAWPEVAALEEIRRGGGTAFDPRLTELFVSDFILSEGD
jgi:HD-GYP domain-containing protein (c-di-GMP phosphodiesterase class II)